MLYKSYLAAQAAALETLLDCGVDSLPVGLSSICRHLGVYLRTYAQGYNILKVYSLGDRMIRSDGLLLRVGEQPIILYNGFRSGGRQRFSIAHELGHLVLGHDEQPASREKQALETAANAFAGSLLSPLPVLMAIGVQSSGQIEYLCSISYQAAQLRMSQISRLLERGYRPSGKAERELCRRFKPYLDSLRQQR